MPDIHVIASNTVKSILDGLRLPTPWGIILYEVQKALDRGLAEKNKEIIRLRRQFAEAIRCWECEKPGELRYDMSGNQVGYYCEEHWKFITTELIRYNDLDSGHDIEHDEDKATLCERLE